MIGAAKSGGEIDGVGMRAYEDGMAEALRCEPYKLLCHRRTHAGRIIRPKMPTRWGWRAPSRGRDQPFGSLERACLIRDCDGDTRGGIFWTTMGGCGQRRLPKRNDRASHGPKTPQAIRRRRFKQPDCELYDIYRAGIAPESRIRLAQPEVLAG